MPHPSVVALGRSEAAMYLRVRSGEVVAIIAICGAGDAAFDAPGIFHRLSLCFDDVEVTDQDDQVGRLRAVAAEKWNREMGRVQLPPKIDDARAIVDFARRIRQLGGTLLCQCQGGVSRSTAAALLCLAEWTGPGQEAACVAELLRVRPCARPHAGLVRYGDDVLARGGALLNALRQNCG